MSTTTNKDDESSSSDDQYLTVTYRKKHHLLGKPKTAGNSKQFLDFSEPTGNRIPKLSESIFLITVVHYFLWALVLLAIILTLFYKNHPYIASLLIALYLPSYFRRDEYRTGRPWHWLRMHPLWGGMQRYLGIEAVRLSAPLDPQKQYMFSCAPHGILILSRPATYGGLFEKLFPGIDVRVLGASAMFQIPGCRELCLWMGAVNADRKVATQLASARVPIDDVNSSGKVSLMVYGGGSKEIFASPRDSTVTTLYARKGFIKLAIQHGLPIVPMLAFGEKQCYHRVLFPKAVT